MSIPVIDTLHALGNFPVANSDEIQCGNQRLDAVLSASATELEAKANKTYVDSELSKKATPADVTVAVSGKADKTYVDSNFATKSEIPTNYGTYSKPTGGIPKSDFANDVQASLGKADTALQSHQSLANYVTTSDSRLSDSRNAKDVYEWAKKSTKPTYTKSEIGLGNVDNTSDLNKPISTATQNALNSKADSSEISGFTERIETVETEQDALSARMDTFTNLSEGSTTGDAELIDIRVHADGSVSNSAGSAVRSQITSLKDSINSLVGSGSINVSEYEISAVTFVQGVIDGTTGSNIESEKRIRSGYVSGYSVKITPESGTKWFPVFYNNNSFVSSETWHTDTAEYILSSLNANQVRIVVAKSDDTAITPTYSSNVKVYTKSKKFRSAMFRGTFEEMGFTTVDSCINDGYYTYTYQTSNSINIPNELKGASGTVEVLSHITASNNDTIFQRVTSSAGVEAFRWVRLNSDIKGDWIFNNNYFKFLGTLEDLAITDIDNCKSEGYYTVKAVTAPNISNLPNRFASSASVIQVFANITTANQKTWYQVVTNSGGETAFRFLREFGTKGDWVYSKPKSDFKWYALGDSITEGYYSTGPNAMSVTSENWVKYASEIIGCTVTNYGIGGSGYMDNVHATDHKNAKEKVNNIDFSNVDLVTLAWGVNDWKYGYPLGTMSDSVSGGASVIANMRYVIEKIISDNPSCKIIVVTPLNCRGYDFDYGTEATNYGLGYTITENGKTLQDFFNGIKEVCEYYGIEMIDNTHNSVVNRKSIVSLLKDGVHPSLECHKALGHEMAKKINFD